MFDSETTIYFTKLRKGVGIITSKETSELLGMPVSALHYYESVGLIIPTRGKNNYRDYTEIDIKRIKLILFMKKVNFSLEEMKISLSHYYHIQDESFEEAMLKDKIDFYLNKKLDFEKRIQEYRASITIMDKVVDLMSKKENKCEKEKTISEIDALVNQFWEEGRNE